MPLQQDDMKAHQGQAGGGSTDTTLCVFQQTKCWSVVYRQLVCCIEASALFRRRDGVIATKEWYATSLARLPFVFYIDISADMSLYKKSEAVGVAKMGHAKTAEHAVNGEAFLELTPQLELAGMVPFRELVWLVKLCALQT